MIENGIKGDVPKYFWIETQFSLCNCLYALSIAVINFPVSYQE
jgi:hypothetical protein